MILVVLREAEADIDDAFRWYELRRAGLGREFIDEVELAFTRILAAPNSFPLAYRGLRRKC